MSPTRRIYELAKRDFMQRAKSKAFLMAMLLTVGIVLIIGPLISLTGGDPEASVVALVGEQPAGSDQAILRPGCRPRHRHPDCNGSPTSPAEAALADGQVAVVVNGTSELVFQDESIAAAKCSHHAAESPQPNASSTRPTWGCRDEDVGSLLFPLQFNERTVEPLATDEDEATEVAALVGLLLLYISILMFGQFVMMGVMEEKQTRVVEVVLSRVKPTQVLIGKVLGIGLLGLIQILAMGAALIFTVSVADLADFDLTGLGIKVLGLLVLWYLLGYTFYSFMYGALGATISRQEDMQGVAMLPVLLILPGFFFGQMALLEPDMWLSGGCLLRPVLVTNGDGSPVYHCRRTAVAGTRGDCATGGHDSAAGQAGRPHLSRRHPPVGEEDQAACGLAVRQRLGAGIGVAHSS